MPRMTRIDCRCGSSAVLAGFKSGAVLAAIIPAGRQVKDAEAGTNRKGDHCRFGEQPPMAVEGAQGSF